MSNVMNSRPEKILLILLISFLNPFFLQGGDAPVMTMKRVRTEVDYKFASLNEIISNKKSAGAQPYRVKVSLSGLIKPISSDRKAALASWANAFASNPLQYTEDYQFELQVSENGQEYWFCAREKDLNFLKSYLSKLPEGTSSASESLSLKPGKEIEIMLLRVGVPADSLLEPAKKSESGEMILLIESFAREK